MTNEEAITILKREFSECKDTISVYAQKRKKAFDMAIQALEQTDVLDKIRAEITEEFDNCSICEWFEDYDYDENDISEYRSVGHISDIIDIINKYKAESEDAK